MATIITGSVVRISGHGATSGVDPNSAGVRRGAASVVAPACGAGSLCIDQTVNPGICQGDSGAPMTARAGGLAHLVGITSVGDQACAQSGVFSSVSAMRSLLIGSSSRR